MRRTYARFWFYCSYYGRGHQQIWLYHQSYKVQKRNQCTNSIRISEKHLKKYKENGYKHAFAHTSIQGYTYVRTSLCVCICKMPQSRIKFHIKDKGVLKKDQELFKKDNRLFLKEQELFLKCLVLFYRCRESVSYHFVEVFPFMRISYEEKAWKRPTLYQAGTVYKKEYIADSKHIMWKSTSKRSEGMRV